VRTMAMTGLRMGLRMGLRRVAGPAVQVVVGLQGSDDCC